MMQLCTVLLTVIIIKTSTMRLCYKSMGGGTMQPRPREYQKLGILTQNENKHPTLFYVFIKAESCKKRRKRLYKVNNISEFIIKVLSPISTVDNEGFRVLIKKMILDIMFHLKLNCYSKTAIPAKTKRDQMAPFDSSEVACTMHSLLSERDL